MDNKISVYVDSNIPLIKVLTVTTSIESQLTHLNVHT